MNHRGNSRGVSEADIQSWGGKDMGSASQSRIDCALTRASKLAEISTRPITRKFRHIGTSAMPAHQMKPLRVHSSSLAVLFLCSPLRSSVTSVVNNPISHWPPYYPCNIAGSLCFQKDIIRAQKNRDLIRSRFFLKLRICIRILEDEPWAWLHPSSRNPDWLR